MYDPMETKAHLQAVFPEDARAVLAKTPSEWNVF